MRSFTCGTVPEVARTAERPIARISAASSSAIWMPSCFSSSTWSAVGGVAGAAACPAMAESGATPSGVAAKSYTTIRPGRASFPPEYVSRSETLVEAQPNAEKKTSRDTVKTWCLFMETSGLAGGALLQELKLLSYWEIGPAVNGHGCTAAILAETL